MLENIPDEYEIDPGTDIDRLAELVVEQYPDAVVHEIDEAIFVDDGPIDYLAWIALDGYNRHEFFYYDTEPDSETLQRLLSWSPDEERMRLLKAYFVANFDIVESIANAAVVEIPDPYLPGPKPRANIAFYMRKGEDEINIGMNAAPPRHHNDIIEDIDKIVPAKDLETFARNTVHAFYDELKTTAEQHLVEGDIDGFLEDNSDFRHQTTKPLPKNIYPTYTGQDADLWQKPVSKEAAIQGSQGFVQVWVPVDADDVGFVTVTSGEYDTEQALAAVRNNIEATLE